MNTKIGTSFGLALLMAIAVFATMFALGMFSTSEVRAEHSGETTNGVHNLNFTPGSLAVNKKTNWDVTYSVTSAAALTPGSGTITITFPDGVVVPTTIDKSRVSAGPGTALIPLTSDPTVSGQTVTITVPATDPNGGTVTTQITGAVVVKISFSQLAGFINPAKSGSAGSTSAGTSGKLFTSTSSASVKMFDDGSVRGPLSFTRTISLGGKTSQTQGGAVTVTVGGFTPGLGVSLSGSVSGSAVVGSDRKAVISGTMKGASGTVTATDLAGLTATSGSIAVKAELSVTATGKAGDTISLTGKNYGASSNILDNTVILFGGTALATNQLVTTISTKLHVDRDADSVLDDFKISVKIPSNAKKGVNQVKVTDASGASATATIEVEGRSVTITPDSGPPGTTVTIVGTGFPASITTSANNTSSISPVFGSSTKTGLFTTGTGALPGSDQFTIPASATTSVITLTVSIQGSDGVASTGSDKFTVTSRVLTVVPSSGPRGTKVLITGTKFSASKTVAADNVTVDGKATTHPLANLTSAGDVPGISVVIPSDAGIGSKTISLTDTGTPTLTGTTKFNVTVPTITVGVASATMGQSVPITGEGWVPGTAITIKLKKGTGTSATKVATADGSGNIETSISVPSSVGVGSQTLTITADDGSLGNTATAQTLKIPKPTVLLSVSEANIGDVVDVIAAGFPPLSGLSTLTIGGADVRSGVVTSDSEGGLVTSFIVPGVTGSNIVTVIIGANTVSTSISVLKASGTAAAATTAPAEIFADVIANDDNLVRVWRFSNAAQTWEFYDPRPAFEEANTLEKSGAGDIVWVNVTSEQAFQSTTLFPGWNLISLD